MPMDSVATLSKEDLLTLVQQHAQTLQQQSELIVFLQQEIATLRQEIARLKGGGLASPLVKPEPPAWVKPNKPAADAPTKPRQKRVQAFVRRRGTPTEETVYA